MIPKYSNTMFAPLRASIPKPATNLMPKLPPIPGQGQMPVHNTIPSLNTGPSAATAPKIASLNKWAAEAALPILVPIPASGPVTSIAKAPEMKEMQKAPGLKMADFGGILTNIARGLKPAAGAIEKEVAPSWSVGSKALSKMTPMEGRSLLGARGAPRIPAMKPPGGPSFSVGREELANMSNQQARGLLGRQGPPPIPKSPGIPDFNSAKTIQSGPPPLPGRNGAVGHGTVVQRLLGK